MKTKVIVIVKVLDGILNEVHAFDKKSHAKAFLAIEANKLTGQDYDSWKIGKLIVWWHNQQDNPDLDVTYHVKEIE